ncbi:hypothetical protein EV424DRAFT_1554308 [Suillus variegatus]|nr:hypothetical protein EV424DRAFT_1644110 [Suillus variegatus]KAG1829321.1 hypothetical protein EV424DRAFT_1554308 [Suillus variegatus]
MAGEGGSSLWNNSAFSGSYTPSPGPSLANMTSPEADSFSPPPAQVPQPQFSLFQQGAYMHENQALRERCGILEAQVTKLSIERDTIQAMFHQLASSVRLDEAVESLGSKGTHLSLAAPCTSNTKRPTRETHPKVKFWNQDAFLDWAERASAQGLHRGKIPYLEGENGELVPEATVKAIRKTLRGGWSELVNRQLAPKSWGKLSSTGNQFIHSLMEKSYPLFTLANNGWKLDYLCKSSYSAWRRNHLDDNGNWKSRKDGNDDSDDDSDDGDSSDAKGKKRKKVKRSKSEVPEKKLKFTPDVSIPPSLPPTPSIPPAVLPSPVLSPSLDLLDSESASIPTTDGDTAEPSHTIIEESLESASVTPTIVIAEPSHPIEESESPTTLPSPITVSSHPAGDPLEEKENIPPPQPPTATPAPIKITVSNPISLLALAAAGVKIPLLPSDSVPMQAPPVPTEKVSVPSDGANSNLQKGKAAKAGSKSSKMRPSPTKNGRNLCALRWLKQIKIGGTTEEFCAYYGDLTLEQRKGYDEEAAALVATDTWTKAVSEGRLY